MTAVDIFSAQVTADPYPTWKALREAAPVYREPRFGQHVLSRFEDVYNVLRDHERFSSADGVGPFGGGGGGTIVTSDPPRHTKLRHLVNRAFTPRTVARMEERMQGIVDQLLAERPGDEFDLVETLSYPLPVIVIAELLGIPPERRADFKRWSDALVGSFDGQMDAERIAAVSEMFAYLSGVLAERKAAPANDLITALTEAEVDGQKLSDIEMLSFALILLVAGNETTTNLISNMLNILGRRPDLWAELRADRGFVENCIEETLRYDSPVQMLGRRVAAPVELRGVQMQPGERVVVLFGSANRDDAEFADGESFDLHRDLSVHVAFGYGIHYCLGAPLARTEARIALNALLDRYSAMEVAGEGHRTQSPIIHGFEALPLRGRPG